MINFSWKLALGFIMRYLVFHVKLMVERKAWLSIHSACRKYFICAKAFIKKCSQLNLSDSESFLYNKKCLHLTERTKYNKRKQKFGLS